jgi:hypothetical protein
MNLLQSALVEPEASVAVIAAIWAVAGLLLTLSYVQGGETWRLYFSPAAIGGKKTSLHPLWIELGLLSYCSILLVIIAMLTPDARLATSILHYWPLTLIAVAIAGWFTFDHARLMRKKEPQDWGERLARLGPDAEKINFAQFRRGYGVYWLYCTMLYGCYALVAIAIALQAIADQRKTDETRRHTMEILQSIEKFEPRAAPGGAGPSRESAVLAEIERAFSSTRLTIKDMTEQINTLLLLFFFVLFVDFALEFTFVGTVFTRRAVEITHYLAFLVFVLLAIIVWAMYYWSYLPFIQEVAQKVDGLYPRVRSADWEIMKRYYELVHELRDRQGISGFAFSLASDRAGILVGFAALQWLWRQTSDVRSVPKHQ